MPDTTVVADEGRGQPSAVGCAHEHVAGHVVHRVADRPVPAGRGQPAPHDHDHAVGHGLDLVQHVRAHDHRAALGAQAAEELDEAQALHGVGAVERLVEHEHERVLHEGGGHLAALAHALAEAVHAPVGDRLHVDGLQGPVDHAAVGEPVQVGDVAAQLARRETAGDGLVLRHEGELPVHLPVGPGRAAGHAHLALVDGDQPGDRPHERGLAGAVRPEQAR